MKREHKTDDVKKIALDDYLSGDKSMKVVCQKYKIPYNTFVAYKARNKEYVTQWQLKNTKTTDKNKIYIETENSNIDPYIDYTISKNKNKNNKDDQIVKDFLDTENYVGYVLSNKNDKNKNKINVDTNSDKNDKNDKKNNDDKHKKHKKHKNKHDPIDVIKHESKNDLFDDIINKIDSDIKNNKTNKTNNLKKTDEIIKTDVGVVTKKKIKIVSFEREIEKLLNESYGP